MFVIFDLAAPFGFSSWMINALHSRLLSHVAFAALNSLTSCVKVNYLYGCQPTAICSRLDCFRGFLRAQLGAQLCHFRADLGLDAVSSWDARESGRGKEVMNRLTLGLDINQMVRGQIKSIVGTLTLRSCRHPANLPFVISPVGRQTAVQDGLAFTDDDMTFFDHQVKGRGCEGLRTGTSETEVGNCGAG